MSRGLAVEAVRMGNFLAVEVEVLQIGVLVFPGKFPIYWGLRSLIGYVMPKINVLERIASHLYLLAKVVMCFW